MDWIPWQCHLYAIILIPPPHSTHLCIHVCIAHAHTDLGGNRTHNSWVGSLRPQPLTYIQLVHKHMHIYNMHTHRCSYMHTHNEYHVCLSQPESNWFPRVLIVGTLLNCRMTVPKLKGSEPEWPNPKEWNFHFKAQQSSKVVFRLIGHFLEAFHTSLTTMEC